MSLFVDTSVWSLALRRNGAVDAPEVGRLARALRSQDSVYTTGLVLQELLQGFLKPRANQAIVERFSSLPMIVPDRQDHIAAADVKSSCRRRGVQLGTIDALLVQLCLRHELTMLTTDRDFSNAARYCPLEVWSGS